MGDFLNIFFRNLRKHIKGKITDEEFKQYLQDEEYINDTIIDICYFCDNQSFDILKGGKDCYEYITNKMSHMIPAYKNDMEETHYLGLLCNWLHSKGIPIFSNAKKYPELNIIICKCCGRILGVKLDKWYFPYLGYIDDIPF